jgi:hypothetical protein
MTDARKKQSHHLWGISDNNDKVSIFRKKEEMVIDDQEDSLMEKEASKTDLEVVANTYWGLFGASMVDSHTLGYTIPNSIANQFNVIASKIDEKPPVVYSWDKLKRAFGDDKINNIRDNIATGMKVRIVSKNFNVPFMVASDIISTVDEKDLKSAKKVVDLIKNNKISKAKETYGKLASSLENLFDSYGDEISHKLAVDESAKKYWENYYGPYGRELVREVKKRVKADLSKNWMIKHGVDESAAEYWSNYYGEYGERWVSIVPKKLSPSKRKSK